MSRKDKTAIVPVVPTTVEPQPKPSDYTLAHVAMVRSGIAPDVAAAMIDARDDRALAVVRAIAASPDLRSTLRTVKAGVSLHRAADRVGMTVAQVLAEAARIHVRNAAYLSSTVDPIRRMLGGSYKRPEDVRARAPKRIAGSVALKQLSALTAPEAAAVMADAPEVTVNK